MSVQSQVNNITYSGNGITTVFNYPFRITTADSLKVLLINATTLDYEQQVLNSNYSVTDVDNINGGTVVFNQAPASGFKVFIARLDQYYVQEMSFLPNSQFSLASLEHTLDRLALQDQQLDLKCNTTLKLPPYETAGLTLASAEVRKNTVLGFDETGKNLTYETVPSGTPTGTFLQAGSGAVERTWQNKVREWVSPEDFGAVHDGATDDAGAFQKAIAASHYIRLKPGVTYLVNSMIELVSDLTIDGSNSVIRTNNTNLLAVLGCQFSTPSISNLHIFDLVIAGNGEWSVSAFPNPAGGGNSVGFTSLTRGIFLPILAGSGIKCDRIKCIGLQEGVRIYNTHGISITNNTITNCGASGLRIDGCVGGRITDNYIEGIYGNTTAAGDTNVLNSKFADGIFCGANQNVTISNNTISDIIRIAIVLEQSYLGAGTQSSRITIANNAISNTHSHRGTEYNAGIFLEPHRIGKGVTVTGNVVDNTMVNSTSGVFGIYAYDGVTVTGNHLLGNNVGIVGDDFIATGNFIDGTSQYPANNKYGIGTTTSASTDHKFHIADNIILNCTITGIEVSAGGSQARGNIMNNYIYHNGHNGMQVLNNFLGHLIISGNTIEDNGISTENLFIRGGIYIAPIPTTPGKIMINNNTFISSMPATPTLTGTTAGQIAGILFSNSQTTQTTQFIQGNTFLFTGAIDDYPNNIDIAPVSYSTTNGGAYAHYEIFQANGNTSNKRMHPVPGNGIATVISAGNLYTDGYYGQRFIGYLQYPPTNGQWMRGDYYLVGQPSATGFIGGVCIASGTPGTWKGFGQIQA